MLEHAGSTSVPGLSAKPKIDIVLGVADTADEAAYVPDMEAAGYVLRIRESDWHEHRLFKGPDTDINLHVFTVGCAEIERMIRFRDHLRENAPISLYEDRNRSSRSGHGSSPSTTPTPNRPVVEEILVRAGATNLTCVFALNESLARELSA